jgi:hypothetical protein
VYLRKYISSTYYRTHIRVALVLCIPAIAQNLYWRFLKIAVILSDNKGSFIRNINRWNDNSIDLYLGCALPEYLLAFGLSWLTFYWFPWVSSGKCWDSTEWPMAAAFKSFPIHHLSYYLTLHSLDIGRFITQKNISSGRTSLLKFYSGVLQTNTNPTGFKLDTRP